MNLGDIATVAGIVVAIALGLVSWWQARSANEKADMANEHAATANTIAERALLATEKQTLIAERTAAASERWRLARHRGDTFELTNTSADDARYVVLHPPEPSTKRGEFEHDVIPAGSSVTFSTSPAMGAGRDLVVTWAAPDGSPQQWTKALPPKA